MSMLVSCVENPPQPPSSIAAIKPLSPSLASPSRRRVFPVPEHKPTPPSENAASAPAAAAQTAALTPQPIAPAPNPKQLIGLDQAAVVRLLGVASEKLEAAPAAIWRYSNATCELDLYFYLNLHSGKMRTLHYAFKRDHSGKEDCLRSLVVARG
ncbi:MAG: hypothetical protein JO007_17365 [Alphaproteobacteria bacterium]|nr:hypothetical protein [Alphaproteobacteria bacterium]